MITVSNVQRLMGLPFATYRMLPQKSFSFLKRERNGVALEIAQTPKMELGTLVDAILTNCPVDMASKLYPAAKAIAHFLRQHPQLGPTLKHMAKQVSYTGLFTHRGISLEVKGRPDFELKPYFINDLKICSANDYMNVIKFMRYEDQLFGYARLAGVKQAYLTVYCVPKKSVHIINVPVSESNLFWEDKILTHGSVLTP